MTKTKACLMALALVVGSWQLALAGHDHADHADHNHGDHNMEAAAETAESYPLSVCPISGEPLGEMGEPYKINLDGVEVQLCCDGCEKKAIAQKERVKKMVRDALIERDGADYPLTTCANCGMKLKEGKAMDMVYGSTLIKICGPMCEDSFHEKGAELAAKVRQARAAEQK